MQKSSTKREHCQPLASDAVIVTTVDDLTTTTIEDLARVAAGTNRPTLKAAIERRLDEDDNDMVLSLFNN